jgi:Ni/Fe-hydrogenase subunit HybB-like protein
MSKTSNFVFWGLYIVAWLIFVGLSIEAGGVIVNFFVSLYKPEFVQNLYQKLDLTEMYKDSSVSFFGIYSFIITISILKACLFYIVIRLMHKMDLSKPFNAFVAKQISQISYYTLSIGLLSYLARQLVKNLMHHGFVVEDLNQFWGDSQAFILMGAVIYIIATIFKKGVDMQTENDLTV